MNYIFILNIFWFSYNNVFSVVCGPKIDIWLTFGTVGQESGQRVLTDVTVRCNLHKGRLHIIQDSCLLKGSANYAVLIFVISLLGYYFEII